MGSDPRNEVGALAIGFRVPRLSGACGPQSIQAPYQELMGQNNYTQYTNKAGYLKLETLIGSYRSNLSTRR